MLPSSPKGSISTQIVDSLSRLKHEKTVHSSSRSVFIPVFAHAAEN